MKLTLSEKEYKMNKQEIDLCIRGEYCTIVMIRNNSTGNVTYQIDTNIIPDGTASFVRTFHFTEDDGTNTRTGLGVFFLEKHTHNQDGTHALEFTDDLNPDVP